MTNCKAPTLITITITLILLVRSLRLGTAFSSRSVSSRHPRRHDALSFVASSATARAAVKGNGGNSDFPSEEETAAEYSGTVDWDAEWKKVVQNGGTKATKSTGQTERPGKDFYKSDAEIAAIRAANKATESAAKLAAQVPSIPSFDSVKGDWKFWVGILAILSFGTALLTAQAPMPTAEGSPSSYYI